MLHLIGTMPPPPPPPQPPQQPPAPVNPLVFPGAPVVPAESEVEDEEITDSQYAHMIRQCLGLNSEASLARLLCSILRHHLSDVREVDARGVQLDISTTPSGGGVNRGRQSPQREVNNSYTVYLALGIAMQHADVLKARMFDRFPDPLVCI